MVRPSGFEPLAFRLGGGCSILLSYGRIWNFGCPWRAGRTCLGSAPRNAAARSCRASLKSNVAILLAFPRAVNPLPGRNLYSQPRNAGGAALSPPLRHSAGLNPNFKLPAPAAPGGPGPRPGSQNNRNRATRTRTPSSAGPQWPGRTGPPSASPHGR